MCNFGVRSRYLDVIYGVRPPNRSPGDIDEYMYLPCVGTKLIKPNGNQVLEGFFNATVYMKFQICFTFLKFENNMLSLCETTNVFIDAFLLLKNPFTSVRTV